MCFWRSGQWPLSGRGFRIWTRLSQFVPFNSVLFSREPYPSKDLVEVSIFLFFLLGEGEGRESEGGGGGSNFYWKSQEGGVSRRERGRGAGRVSAAGGLNIFFRGRNVHQEEVSMQSWVHQNRAIPCGCGGDFYPPPPSEIARSLRPQDARRPCDQESLANGDFLCNLSGKKKKKNDFRCGIPCDTRVCGENH